MTFGPDSAKGDYGTRVGFAFASSLSAGELVIPMEWGLSLRTASISQPGWFGRDVFTDLQFPVLLHGAPFWKPLEILALWTPSYTLDMVSYSSFAGQVPGAGTLRTRFNMGFGAGLQIDLPAGFRLRSHWVYNLFSPWPASRMTWSDLNIEAALPLAFEKAVP